MQNKPATSEMTTEVPSNQVSDGEGTIDSSPSAEVEEEMTGTTKTFEVTGEPFMFTPAEIRVKVGDTVRINFTNKAGMHDWVIDEFSARTKVLQAGQSETIEFVAEQAGTFEYYCSVANHRAQGMVGKL